MGPRGISWTNLEVQRTVSIDVYHLTNTGITLIKITIMSVRRLRPSQHPNGNPAYTWSDPYSETPPWGWKCWRIRNLIFLTLLWVPHIPFLLPCYRPWWIWLRSKWFWTYLNWLYSYLQMISILILTYIYKESLTEFMSASHQPNLLQNPTTFLNTRLNAKFKNCYLVASSRSIRRLIR